MRCLSHSINGKNLYTYDDCSKDNAPQHTDSERTVQNVKNKVDKK
jgi:hypothetical protein